MKMQTDVQQMIQETMKRIQDIKHSAELRKVSKFKAHINKSQLIMLNDLCIIKLFIDFSEKLREGEIRQCRALYNFDQIY